MPGLYRVGIDIGGTFTDATLINEVSGRTSICKVPSTPASPEKGFLDALTQILKDAGASTGQLRYVVHSTTVATNAIIQGKTAEAAFITTEGFSDMLEIALQIRPSLYDLMFEKPQPLIPRNRCYGVTERLDSNGLVLTPLDEDSVSKVVDYLKAEKISSVAICLLHSYANPSHEKKISSILKSLLPGVLITTSSDIAPEMKEYLRASTTVVNACIAPFVSEYLSGIEQTLRAEGVDAELLVMQSSGGVYTFDAAMEKPVFMVESGPASGVIAASHIGNILGHENIISLDMGGTTAKTGLILDGTPQVTKDYEVGGQAGAIHGAGKGSGYPIRTPVIDLVEIGAGGGSIAWVDSGGALRVGPASAGADPGPACYGAGGTKPTVTDANLVLGRLNPDYFLGGSMPLDTELAKNAIYEECARPLDLDILEAANGIVEIANLAMVNAMRLISVRRGYDPRDFVMIAFGGAGPVHANRLAIEMGIPVTIIPRSPGIASATGLLTSDLKFEFSTTDICLSHLLTIDKLTNDFHLLEGRGRRALEREGVDYSDMDFEWVVDMRYSGQSFELTVPVTDRKLSKSTITKLVNNFHDLHQNTYGFKSIHEELEMVRFTVIATGFIPKPPTGNVHDNEKSPANNTRANRSVYFGEINSVIECEILNRYTLSEGSIISGPCIIEEFDSTTVVHPNWQALVDNQGNLALTLIK